MNEHQKYLKIKTKDLSLIIFGSSLYLILGFVFQNIAFGSIQIRIADSLYPLISILGFPFLISTFLGHLIFNCYGFVSGIALGFGDLLSPFIFIIPKYIIYKFGKTNEGLILTTHFHVMVVSLWVSWLLYTLFNIPILLGISSVYTGEIIAEMFLGIPLTVAIKRRLQNVRK